MRKSDLQWSFVGDGAVFLLPGLRCFGPAALLLPLSWEASFFFEDEEAPTFFLDGDGVAGFGGEDEEAPRIFLDGDGVAGFVGEDEQAPTFFLAGDETVAGEALETSTVFTGDRLGTRSLAVCSGDRRRSCSTPTSTLGSSSSRRCALTVMDRSCRCAGDPQLASW